MSGFQLDSQISVAVAKKSLDAAKQQGAAVVELIQAAAEAQAASQRGSSAGDAGHMIDTVA